MRFKSEIAALADTYVAEHRALADFSEDRWEMNKSSTRRAPDVVKAAGPPNFFNDLLAEYGLRAGRPTREAEVTAEWLQRIKPWLTVWVFNNTDLDLKAVANMCKVVNDNDKFYMLVIPERMAGSWATLLGGPAPTECPAEGRRQRHLRYLQEFAARRKPS